MPIKDLFKDKRGGTPFAFHGDMLKEWNDSLTQEIENEEMEYDEASLSKERTFSSDLTSDRESRALRAFQSEMNELQEMQQRLSFMIGELEEFVSYKK